MSRDEWNALVEQARASDMLRLAAAHGAQLSRYGHSGEYVGACPVCGDGRDRFSINSKKGVFNCRVCGKGGHGAIDLEMFLGGCDFVEAVKWLTNTTSLSGQRLPTAKNLEAAAAHERARERDEAEQQETATWLWAQRQPAIGSPVKRYLQARGYVGAIPPTVGYLPARGEHPHAMISAFALPNEIEPGELSTPLKVRSVHLTKLLPDGCDRIREKQGKIIISRPLGLPIAISPITDGLSLAITEGIEDALAYRAAGFAAWAAGSAPFIPALAEHIPDYVTTIIIEQHNDPDGKAQKAVARLQELLRERKVRPAEPKPRPLFIRNDPPVEFYPAERPIEIIIREAGDK
jgi:hypothetical protein